MKSSDYWKKRMEALEASQYQKSVAYYQDVQEQYRKAVNEVVLDIEHWYQRLADNNDISLAAAKRLLKKDELEEFRWSVKQYIKAGKENAVDQRWLKELENASAKYHISYLQAMKLQMQQHAELLATEFEGGITTFLHKSYGDQYYRTAFEIAKGTGVGSNLAKLDSRKIELLLKKPWAQDGKNFSDRIWTDKEKLVNRLHTELTQNIIRGAPPDKAIENISKAMNVSRKQAGKLVMTESAAISSRAQQDCFKELGVEEFEVVVTFDHITCDLCREMDGKYFPLSDFRIGVTAPPFHPFCRCCTIPHFKEDFGQIGERTARDPETGKTYYVPADMTYEEWKDSFVEEADSSKMIKRAKSRWDILTRKRPPVSLKDLKSPYKNSIAEVIDNAPKCLREILMDNQDRIVFAKTDALGRFHYVSDMGIFINLEKDFENKRGSWTTLFHEIGHNVDRMYRRPSQQAVFIDALKGDFENFTNRYKLIYNVNIEEAYKIISLQLAKATDEESHVLSDLFGGLSDGKCVGNWKHPPGYWKSDKKIGREAFAHFFSACATNNRKKLEKIRMAFPHAYSEFLRILEEMR